uniref:Putative transposable element n=1 Tax=Ixodes ricinus TaxID=34613 RepID=A0A6B0UUJ9_IXORI
MPLTLVGVTICVCPLSPLFLFSRDGCRHTCTAGLHLCTNCIIIYRRFVSKKWLSPERPPLLLLIGRVASRKKQTLLRLELMGTVIASRVRKYLEKSIPDIPYEYAFWTNPLITLAWMETDLSKCKIFATNRVTEIQRDIDPSR